MRTTLILLALILTMAIDLDLYAQTDLRKAQNLATCLRGRYPNLCQHAWLTPDDQSKVEAAERRENLRTCLAGRYPSLCKKNKLSPEELDQVVIAEKRENLKICMAGTYASLCDRSLLTPDQAVQAQAAERNSAESRRQVIARAGSRGVRWRGLSGCEDGHWIESVSSSGMIIKLEDGSIWEIDAVDAVDTALWLPVSDIVACDNKLINTDDNESVSARRIR